MRRHNAPHAAHIEDHELFKVCRHGRTVESVLSNPVQGSNNTLSTVRGVALNLIADVCLIDEKSINEEEIRKKTQ